MITPRWDHRGYVIDPNLHDADLIGIACTPHRAQLFVGDRSSVSLVVVLEGVERFRAVDFLQGNIIERLIISDHGVRPEQLEFIFDVDGWRPYLDPVAEACRTGELIGFEMTSSYGCRLMALCKSVHVETANKLDIG